jgi:uncharacterized protein (TIGR00297 family)
VFVSFFLGLTLAAAVAAAAAKLEALTLSGAIAATVVGTLVFMAGGFKWSALLFLFFVTSSALSRLQAKEAINSVAAKSSRRDVLQVLANGGIPALCAALAIIHPSTQWLPSFAGATAAATADTWATEIGAWSRSSPVHILTGVPVAPGTSGGVTRLGMGATCAGALLITLAVRLLFAANLLTFFGVAIAGVAGSVVDSLLGATIQERRWCPLCQTVTEQGIHRTCSTPTLVVGGWRGINNDVVNALASATGSLVPVFVTILAHVL